MSSFTSLQKQLEYWIIFYDSRFRVDTDRLRFPIPYDIYESVCHRLIHESNDRILGYVITGDKLTIAHTLVGNKRSILELYSIDYSSYDIPESGIFYGAGDDEGMNLLYTGMKSIYKSKSEYGIKVPKEYIPEK